MTLKVLVVGGTGPTGVPLVEMLLKDGHEVAVFHTGNHEVPFDGQVEHMHGDPRDADGVTAALVGREWDIAICTSGRLVLLADALRGKVRRLVGVTGSPVYAGSMQVMPHGRLRLPVAEDAPTQSDSQGYAGRIARGEEGLLAAQRSGDYEAVIVRYPGIYGPLAPLNNEWVIVKHCLDKRPYIVVPDGGTSYFHRAYVKNAARLLLLCAFHPKAAGQVFNAGDERVMSAADVVETIASELNHELAIEPVPALFCRGIFPMADRATQILDISKARNLIGYSDVIDVETATRETAQWLAHNPPDLSDSRAGGPPAIDYAMEDRLSEWWRQIPTEVRG